ncbi:MAG: VWA domain-containing protein [Deltaproteobacteria bacterium]|nr:VWA domain-containing protein [Deltaproteobacteria bacterium]
MFTDFFYTLRQYGIKVSFKEWHALLSALDKGLIGNSLDRFYNIARAILVKDESEYDLFDQIFLHTFRGAMEPSDINDQIWDWLNRVPLERHISQEEIDKLKKLSLDELQKLFEERLKEQKEQHHGGNRWIGTGGTSPFGHGGHHPSGMRVGGESGRRSAMKIAAERRFRNYRKDLTLDIRQIQVALKKLRELKRHGSHEELDLDATIEKTGKNAGEIELVFAPPRKNQTKLLLLMDVGGTMDPYAHLVSQLFSAAHASNHFKDFKFFYFHNCVYSRLYTDVERSKTIATQDVLNKYNEDYKLIFVGDAWMHPYELFFQGGHIDYFSKEKASGIHWLQRLKQHFRKSIWLNPERQSYWGADTIAAIAQIFPMFPLSIAGLEEGISKLK